MILSIKAISLTKTWPVNIVLPWMVATIALLLMACGGEESPITTTSSQQKLTVVTSIYPLQYLAQRIGGNLADVVNLTPPGVEPHDWEPSPRDMITIQRANLFIYNGAGFEPWVNRATASLPKKGPIVVNATEGLLTDPHVWLDPYLYEKQADLIMSAFTKADPTRANVYATNLAKLKENILELAKEMKNGLASCERNTIVVSHAAFGRLAERFGIRQIAISGLSPEAEPSPARMREIVRQVQELGVTHIFFETLASPAVAQAIARETGVQTLVLNPLEGLRTEELQGGEDYFTVMRKNLVNLRRALGCR